MIHINEFESPPENVMKQLLSYLTNVRSKREVSNEQTYQVLQAILAQIVKLFRFFYPDTCPMFLYFPFSASKLHPRHTSDHYIKTVTRHEFYMPGMGSCFM